MWRNVFTGPGDSGRDITGGGGPCSTRQFYLRKICNGMTSGTRLCSANASVGFGPAGKIVSPAFRRVCGGGLWIWRSRVFLDSLPDAGLCVSGAGCPGGSDGRRRAPAAGQAASPLSSAFPFASRVWFRTPFGFPLATRASPTLPACFMSRFANEFFV